MASLLAVTRSRKGLLRGDDEVRDVDRDMVHLEAHADPVGVHEVVRPVRLAGIQHALQLGQGDRELAAGIRVVGPQQVGESLAADPLGAAARQHLEDVPRLARRPLRARDGTPVQRQHERAENVDVHGVLPSARADRVERPGDAVRIILDSQ